MIRKRVVRVLVYDGPVEWVNRTMERNYVRGVIAIPGCPSGDITLKETVVSSVCYDTAAIHPEGE